MVPAESHMPMAAMFLYGQHGEHAGMSGWLSLVTCFLGEQDSSNLPLHIVKKGSKAGGSSWMTRRRKIF